MTDINPENESVVIVDDDSARTKRLAQSTGLPVAKQDIETPYSLQWVNENLTLRKRQNKQKTDISIDFTSGRSLHRLKFGGGHGQPMARAVKSRDKPLICDATAGFGKDAFVFASLGCEVVLLERSIVVHALLNDALHRAANHPATRPVAELMHLYRCDSTLLPDQWPHHCLPQVVYLDPMYPAGKRTAKKGIQTLRDLLPKDHTEESLLSAARATADRVVVKRPRKAPSLAQQTPAGHITSPNTRYDIYAKLA